MPTVQQRNDQMVNLLSSDFRLLYSAVHAWGDVVSMYQQLPGLIGFWDGSTGIATNSDALRDRSASGIHLGVKTGGPTERYDIQGGIKRWVNFGGGGAFSIADSTYTSILGNESAILSTHRGLTVMAWVRPANAAPAASEGIIGKYRSGQKSWLLYRTTGLNAQLIVSSDGTTDITVTTTNDLITNEWRFVAARWTPSTQVKIWEGFTYGLVTNQNSTSIPATLFDSSENLAVGAFSTSTTPTGFITADMCLIALCRMALPDIYIETIFDMTRPLFLPPV